MTTVAWTDGVVAADSQGTRGAAIDVMEHRKILTPAEGEEWRVMGARAVVFAYAGSASGFHYFQEALASEEGLNYRTNFNCPVDLSINALIVDELGRGWFGLLDCEGDGKTPQKFAFESVCTPFAFGSGQVYANAAMSLDRNAIDAVKLAIARDVYSGGQVQYFELPSPVTKATPRLTAETVNDQPIEKDPYGPVVPHPNAPPLVLIEDPVTGVQTGTF